MSNILQGLFNGKIIPWERRCPDNKAQRTILQKIENEERYFIEKMSLDDCKRFQDYAQLHLDRLAGEEDEIFSYGFTLGLLLMMDITEQAKLIIEG